MAIDAETIQANREYFTHKLQFEKERVDVLRAVQGEHPYDFVLLDTRGKAPFAEGHIPGARCISSDEVDQVISQLPKEKEIVAYCWGHD